MIRFEEIEKKVLTNFYGGNGNIEARIFADDLNKIMKSVFLPGSSSGMHLHETSSEIIYVLSGRGKAIIEGKEEVLEPGVCHYCKKGQSHSVINDGDENLVMFCIVPVQ